MNWEQIFETYYSKEDNMRSGLVQYLKDNYHVPFPKQDGFMLNKNTCTVTHNGKEIRLKKKTFKMLYYIYSNRPNIVTRQEIYDNVWEDTIVEERTIDAHVYCIRKAIPEIPLQIVKCIGLIWKEN